MATISVERLPHWEADPDAWDEVFLGGDPIPGLAKVSVKQKRKVDKKSAKGSNGATVTTQGWEPAEVEISIRTLDPADYEAMFAFAKMLKPSAKNANADKNALGIISGPTSFWDILAIVIEEIDGPGLKDGILETSIKAVEHTAPAAKTTGAGGAGGAGLLFGFFLDQTGAPLPGTYVARQGLAAKKDDGKPLLDPSGKQVYAWQQLAVMADGKIAEVAATFLGTFFSPDGLIKIEWEKLHPPGGKPKDVTATPQASKGAATLGDFTPSDNDPPDPTDTDGGP